MNEIVIMRPIKIHVVAHYWKKGGLNIDVVTDYLTESRTFHVKKDDICIGSSTCLILAFTH